LGRKIIKCIKNMIKSSKRLKNAIFSKKKAAYLGILIYVVGPLTRLLDNIIFYVFAVFFRKNKRKDRSRLKCILLFSTPRSGSTIIYQYLAKGISCHYISNLHVLLPNLASFIFSKKTFAKTAIFWENYYGYTSSLFDVNEGNYFIDKLFKNNPDKKLLRKRFLKLLKQIDHTGNLPIVIKNVRNYDKVSKLYEAVPEVCFIQITREANQIIQSVLKAYYELGTFHPITNEMKSVNTPVLKACMQYYSITNTLTKQFADILDKSKAEINYETFCNDPKSVIEKISVYFFEKDLKLNSELNSLPDKFNVSNKQKVTDAELEKINNFLQEKRMK
jgi:hypothetical protein